MTQPRKPTTARSPSVPAEKITQDKTVWLNGLTLMAELASLNTDDPLNDNELKSVRAVVAYVAVTQKVSEETVGAVLATAFGASDIQKLPRKSYEEVINFLIDLRMDEVFN